ncbi:T9SS type A sorting domain-containing protein [Flavobacterium sp.]|uniref:T9SS type A sorting domain-containing protein n=1 Tax=Flavobacterium sp. TaxID=239 RepID=UPI003D6B87F9
MKKIYFSVLTLVLTAGYAQTTIFSENVGTPASTIAISANTFQNGSPIVFSGTADIRNSLPSGTPLNTYTGASGSGCIFFGGTDPAKNLIIEGINTLNYTDLILSFGQQKGTNAANNELTVQVSADGTNWTPLTYTRATGGGTSVWILITPTGTIPTTANLRIKFENPVSNIGFRVDDIKLTGNLIPLSVVKRNEIDGLKIYPNPVKTNLFVTSNSFETKQVEIYNVLGKIVLLTKVTNAPVNVSALTTGVYMIKVTEEGKTATRKLVIE